MELRTRFDKMVNTKQKCTYKRSSFVRDQTTQKILQNAHHGRMERERAKIVARHFCGNASAKSRSKTFYDRPLIKGLLARQLRTRKGVQVRVLACEANEVQVDCYDEAFVTIASELDRLKSHEKCQAIRPRIIFYPSYVDGNSTVMGCSCSCTCGARSERSWALH